MSKGVTFECVTYWYFHYLFKLIGTRDESCSYLKKLKIFNIDSSYLNPIKIWYDIK